MSQESRIELPPFEAERAIAQRSEFGTVITAMVTPFKYEDGVGTVDLVEARRVANFLERTGSEGLVVAGTTGESPALSFGSQIRLIEEVADEVNIPVIAGTGANTTREAVELTSQATKIEGVSAILAVSPYYNRPPQRGIKDYFERLADSADGKPVIMYDIPARTGRAVETETILELASGVKNIVGIKVASGNPGQTAEIKRKNPDFLVYSGDDSMNMRHFRAGADGAISVVSHWAAKPIKYMYELAQLPIMKDKGYLREIDNMLKTSYEFASMYPNPIPVKAMMRHLVGPEVGYCESPMVIGRDQEEELYHVAREVNKGLKQYFEAHFNEPLVD